MNSKEVVNQSKSLMKETSTLNHKETDVSQIKSVFSTSLLVNQQST